MYCQPEAASYTVHTDKGQKMPKGQLNFLAIICSNQHIFYMSLIICLALFWSQYCTEIVIMHLTQASVYLLKNIVTQIFTAGYLF